MVRTKTVTRPVTPATTTPLQWEVTESETIEAFAYVAPYKDLLVRFKSGGSYVYRDVDPGLVARLRRRHPWHEIGAELRDASKHPFERLATIRTNPLKGRKPRAKAAK